MEEDKPEASPSSPSEISRLCCRCHVYRLGSLQQYFCISCLNLCRNKSRPGPPASTGSCSYISPTYAGLCQISKRWSHCTNPQRFFLLIRVTAPGTRFKAKPWSTASSSERRDQFCWQQNEPLMSSALDGGLSDRDGEHYWTAALWKYMKITEWRTLRLATQTALLTTQVAVWQQEGEEETGSTNRLVLLLLSTDLNCCYWLLGFFFFFRGVPIAQVFAFADLHMATEQHRFQKTLSSLFF